MCVCDDGGGGPGQTRIRGGPGAQLKRILRMEPTVLFWLPQSEKLL